MTNEIANNNPFINYQSLLSQIDVTPDQALQRMWETQQYAVSIYDIDTILQLFASNLIANQKKYDQLVIFFSSEFYPFDDFYRSEHYSSIRTPNLVNSSNVSTTGSVNTARHQTVTQVKTPRVSTTLTHSNNPMDDSGLKVEYQDINESTSGTDQTSTSYTGDPDTTASSSVTNGTTTATGTENVTENKVIHGRNANHLASEIIADGLKAAAAYDILDIIINDISDSIFLQVWM